MITSGLKVVLGMALALLLTSKIIARGYLRSVIFFPVLVSTIGVGLTFTVLMNPEQGLINNALGAVGINGPGWLTNPSLAMFSVALVDVWKGVGLATVIYIAGLVSIPQDYYEAAEVDGASRGTVVPAHHAAARPAGHRHGDHPLPDRRPAVLRPDLGYDQGRSRLRLRRHRVGDLQAIPGRLLRPVHGRQRRAVPGSDRHHRSADLVAEPRGGVAMKNTRGVVIGVARHRRHGRSSSWCRSPSSSSSPPRRAAVNPASVLLAAALRAAGQPEAGVAARDYLMIIAFINSLILTVVSVAAMVIFGAMVAYVWQRRASRLNAARSISWCSPA